MMSPSAFGRRVRVCAGRTHSLCKLAWHWSGLGLGLLAGSQDGMTAAHTGKHAPSLDSTYSLPRLCARGHESLAQQADHADLDTAILALLSMHVVECSLHRLQHRPLAQCSCSTGRFLLRSRMHTLGPTQLSARLLRGC